MTICACMWSHDSSMLNHAVCAAAEDRVLWYSAQYRDWDVTNGSVAQEVLINIELA